MFDFCSFKSATATFTIAIIKGALLKSKQKNTRKLNHTICPVHNTDGYKTE